MVGKQFPPWTEGEDVWGVQNIMHPDLATLASLSQDVLEDENNGAGRPRESSGTEVFKEWYGSEDMLRVSAALMGCSKEDMQFGESCQSKLNALHTILKEAIRNAY